MSRVAPSVVELLPGRHGEPDLDLERAVPDRRRGPRRLLCALCHHERLCRDRYRSELVCRGFCDEQVRVAGVSGRAVGVLGEDDEDVGWFRKPARQSAQGLRDGVVATDRAVVGVCDRDRPVGKLGDAQRVLEACLCRGSVLEPEVEEPHAHLRGDGAVARIETAQRRRLRVRDPDRPVCGRGETGGLRVPRGLIRRRGVAQPLIHRAGQLSDDAGAGIEVPDRVVARHRDDDSLRLRRPEDVPGARQLDRGAGLLERRLHPRVPDDVVVRADHELLTGAGEGRDDGCLAGRTEAHAAQQVVHGVCDDEIVTRGVCECARQFGDSTGLGELRGVVRTVRAAPLARADALEDAGAGRVELDERVVAGVRDEEIPLVPGHVCEADDLAGVGQVALDGRGRHVGAVAAVESALRLVLGDQFLDEGRQA